MKSIEDIKKANKRPAKKVAPKKATKKAAAKKAAKKVAKKGTHVKQNGPDRKIVRITLDFALQAENNFDMPSINPAAMTHINAYVVGMLIPPSAGLLDLLPNGLLKISMCDRPPRGMTPKKEK